VRNNSQTQVSNSKYDQNQDADKSDRAGFGGFFGSKIRGNPPDPRHPRPNLEFLILWKAVSIGRFPECRERHFFAI